MKKLFIAASVALALSACTNSDPNAYTIQGSVSDVDGQAVLLLMGQGDTLAVDTVRNGAFTLKGVSDSVPQMGLIFVDRAHRTQLFLEPGTMACNLDNGQVTGTPLNDELNSFSLFVESLNFNDPTANQDSLEQLYMNKMAEMSSAHVGDPLGLVFVQQQAYDFTKAELDSVMDLCDLYKNDPDLQKLSVSKSAEENTSAGHPYIDIEGINAATGEPAKLSDILSNGLPTVVDFWASWCGPCRQEIKQSLSKYAPQYKGKCNFVGIAVWENSIDDTKKAMDELPISWPIIFAGDRQNTPTTQYGINGIPEIMLIGADGTILNRGLRGKKIAEAIEEALK